MPFRIICSFNGIKKFIYVQNDMSLEELISSIIKVKFSIPVNQEVVLLHTQFGVIIDEIDVLKDGDSLEVSFKNPFLGESDKHPNNRNDVPIASHSKSVLFPNSGSELPVFPSNVSDLVKFNISFLLSI